MDGINRIAFSVFGLDVYWYGVFMALAVLAGFLYASWENKRRGLPKDLMLDLVIVLVPLGVIGARLYYVAFSWSEFAANPMLIFAIRDGGMAIYGTIIACVIGLLVFCKVKKLPFLTLMDALVPALILGQAIGRWGNFFNQEVYGFEIINKSLQFFPAGVQIGGKWYLALFFYEMVGSLISFFVLVKYSKKQRHSGNVFLLYLALYGSIRAVLENLRMDEYILKIWNMPVSMILSVLLVIAAVALLIFRSRKPVPEDIIYNVNYGAKQKEDAEPVLDESLSLLKGKSVSDFLDETDHPEADEAPAEITGEMKE